MRRRGLAGGIRWFAAGTGLILVLLLAGRAAGTAAENLDRDACRRAVETGGRWLVDYVWHQARPGSGGTGGRTGDGWETGDPDPAYRQYEAVKTFYEEHQYLAWYGNEETGETKAENGETQNGETTAGQTGDSGTDQSAGGAQALAQGETGAGAVPAGAALVGVTSRAVTGPTYVMEQLADYDFLMKHFYSVHTSTTAGRDEISAARLLGEDLSIGEDNSKPQILIYHTHSQEAFKDSGPGETVVGIGNCLSELVTAKG